MKTKRIDIKGWDILVDKDYFYYRRINDEFGTEISYHKSNLLSTCSILEEEYNVIKYGVNYKKYLNLIGSNIDYSAKLPNGSIVCAGFRDSNFYFIDKNGNILEVIEGIGFDNIYSFDIDKHGNIWFAIPTANYVGQYSISKSKEIFHLGEKYEEGKPFNLPEDVKIYEDFLYISDMENNRIIKLNIETKEWSIHLSFNEPTWEYRVFKNNELVRLKSGIYLIEK